MRFLRIISQKSTVLTARTTSLVVFLLLFLYSPIQPLSPSVFHLISLSKETFIFQHEAISSILHNIISYYRRVQDSSLVYYLFLSFSKLSFSIINIPIIPLILSLIYLLTSQFLILKRYIHCRS